jgi:hypothetical protein
MTTAEAIELLKKEGYLILRPDRVMQYFVEDDALPSGVPDEIGEPYKSDAQEAVRHRLNTVIGRMAARGSARAEIVKTDGKREPPRTLLRLTLTVIAPEQ